MKSVPVFLLPDIGKTSTSVDELLKRHELYLSHYFHGRPDIDEKAFVFISGSNKPVAGPNNYLTPIVISKNSIPSFLFMLRVHQYLKNENVKPAFVVAGTPFSPYQIALLLKVLQRKLKIQVAVHGEFSSYKTADLSGALKSIFLFTTLRFANAVRFVSKQQSEGFSRLISKKRQQIFITPVPTSVPDVQLEKKPQSIGFVGRLHEERGVIRWGKIASKLTDVEKVVVGTGPLFEKFSNEYPDFECMGQLTADQMEEAWIKIGVLLSTAPHESYGLAMREALLRNIPVVSTKNAGSLQLEGRFPNIFKTFDSNEEAMMLIKEFISQPPDQKYFSAFSDWFEKEQDKSLAILADVWRNLSS